MEGSIWIRIGIAEELGNEHEMFHTEAKFPVGKYKEIQVATFSYWESDNRGH